MINQACFRKQDDYRYNRISHYSPVTNTNNLSTICELSSDLVHKLMTDPNYNDSRVEVTYNSNGWQVGIHQYFNVNPNMGTVSSPAIPYSKSTLECCHWINVKQKKYTLSPHSISYAYDKDTEFLKPMITVEIKAMLIDYIYGQDLLDSLTYNDIELIEPMKTPIRENDEPLYPSEWFDNLTEFYSTTTLGRNQHRTEIIFEYQWYQI